MEFNWIPEGLVNRQGLHCVDSYICDVGPYRGVVVRQPATPGESYDNWENGIPTKNLPGKWACIVHFNPDCSNRNTTTLGLACSLPEALELVQNKILALA